MEEIELGARVCDQIKNIYYSNISWYECHNDIVKQFGMFKRIMKNIYPEESILEILKKVQKFDTLDIQEVFSMKDDYLKEEIKQENVIPKYDKKVVWVPVPVEKVELLENIRKLLKD